MSAIDSSKIGPADLAYANFNYFSEWCFNEKFRNTWFHKKWGGVVQDKSVKRAINLAPRNSAKTTIWAKKAPLWLLGRDPNIKILLLSRTMNRASANMRFIKNNIEANKRVQAVFPNLKPSMPWSDDEIVVKNTRNDGEASILARGLEGSITGLRADILCVDDLIDKTNVMTDTQRSKVHEFWDEQVMPVLNPDARIFIIGTRYSNKDFYSRLLEEESYKNNAFIFTAFKLDDEGKEVLGADGKPISYWPERWPTDRLLQMKEEITYSQGSFVWNSQFMNNPTSFEGSLFKSDWLQFYTVKDDIESRITSLDYIMAVDPNIKEDSKSDDTAIVTAAVDRRHNEIFVLDIYSHPLEFTSQVRKIQEYAARPTLRVGKTVLPGETKISKIGVEANAYQKSLQTTGYMLGLPIVECPSSRIDKITRLLRLAPHIENARVKFPDPEVHKCDWWDKFFDQYVSFPRGRRDDCMDALELLVSISDVASMGSSIPFGPGGDNFARAMFEPESRLEPATVKSLNLQRRR